MFSLRNKGLRLWVTTRGNYHKAFLTCRKHRIDLNVIVDRDPKLFRERLSSFIEQVKDVDYINLFLTNLGSVVLLNLPTGANLRSVRSQSYSILTAYVVKRPSDLEAGLRVLLQLRGNETVHQSKLKPNDVSLSRACTDCG